MMKKAEDKQSNLLGPAQKIEVAKRLIKIRQAKDSLIAFTEFTMPTAEAPEDASQTIFETAKHLELIAEKLEKLERGECRRLIICMPPRHGKPVWEEEYVLMGDMTHKRLREIEVGDFVIGHSGKPCMVTAVHIQGRLDTLIIRTDSGRSVIAEATHPFMTLHGWKNAGDLLVGGDKLAIMMKGCSVAADLPHRRGVTKETGGWYEDFLKAYKYFNEPENVPFITYDQVVSVRSAGTLPCRCLTVDTDETFVVNDFIVHNSELVSRRLIPWCLGRQMGRKVIFATYGQEFAEDFGRDVREIIKSQQFKQVFPDLRFRKAGAASDRLNFMYGGEAFFVGREGTITGRGGDIIVVDDPLKDAQEARSKAARDEVWRFFTDTLMTRQMTGASVVIVMTRWHEDDLVGRLTDPKNPCYDEEEAKTWEVLRLPAIAEQSEDGSPDPLGRAFGEVLWPKREGRKKYYDLEFLLAQKRLNKASFSALYQQRPSPLDGDFFKKEMILTYKPGELPKNLRVYVVSDHAVSTEQRADYTVILTVGVDDVGNIWVLDMWRQQAPADVVVEKMLDIMKNRKPLMWFAEKGHISKSIGPFLRKRMKETQTYIYVNEMTPVKDHQ